MKIMNGGTDMANPKPLDLEELIKLIENEFTEKIQKIDASHRARWLCIDYYRWQTVKDEIKQQIKEACEFYLRYKNDPKLLIREHPDKAKIEIDYETAEDVVNEIEKIIEKYGQLEAQATIRLKLMDYNEWLFKLAFKKVLK